MRTVHFEIPDLSELNDQDLKMALAVKLYEAGKISTGQAADIVGISKRNFIETMANFDSSLLINYSIDDFIADMKNA